MRLLIVDDEKITREGLKEAIDWNSIGITEIAIADDGVNGLETAKAFNPDVVLSDVRMPRMTGIEMCEAIQGINKDLRIVFMSGYSDKEYLKSAIRLKAVSYVEKPINEDEIKEAVSEAVALAKDALIDRESKLRSSKRELEAIADKLCQQGRVTAEEILRYAEEPNNKGCAFSVIIKAYHQNVATSSLFLVINDIMSEISQSHYMKCIGCDRHDYIYVFHMYDMFGINDTQKRQLGALISEKLSVHIPYFHIVIGKNVSSLLEVYGSYNTAVIELQKCFYSENKEVRIYTYSDNQNTFKKVSHEEEDKELKKLLIDGKGKEVYSFLELELNRIISSPDVLPNQVKEIYYRRFNIISEVEAILGMSEVSNKADSTWGMVSSCESIYELDDELRTKVEDFLNKTTKRTESSKTVAMIKEYIARCYSDDLLSIKDISEHVFLSTSYVCTLFKNETGHTLNQYITDYRIEKAKELLLDPRNRIGDISKNVGYADGNYFGKTFKKQVGMTPSEFRERNGI